MDTVTTEPAYGSVEYYAPMLASFAGPGEEKWFLGLAVDLIENALTEGSKYPDSARLAHARNVLAAAELARADMKAAEQ